MIEYRETDIQTASKVNRVFRHVLQHVSNAIAMMNVK